MVGVQAPAKNGRTDGYFSYSLLLYNDGPYFKFSEGFSLFVDCEDAVAEAYQAYRAARPHEQTPPSAIAVGYQFLQSGRVQDALVVFRLNAADFPNDATSQYQLGEALSIHRPAGAGSNAIREDAEVTARLSAGRCAAEGGTTREIAGPAAPRRHSPALDNLWGCSTEQRSGAPPSP
jgi:hypothetical protein